MSSNTPSKQYYRQTCPHCYQTFYLLEKDLSSFLFRCPICDEQIDHHLINRIDLYIRAIFVNFYVFTNESWCRQKPINENDTEILQLKPGDEVLISYEKNKLTVCFKIDERTPIIHGSPDEINFFISFKRTQLVKRKDGKKKTIDVEVSDDNKKLYLTYYKGTEKEKTIEKVFDNKKSLHKYIYSNIIYKKMKNGYVGI